MEKKVYFICGRPRIAVKVASCSNGNYVNFSTPQVKQLKLCKKCQQSPNSPSSSPSYCQARF